jgi:cell division protein FtsA
MSFDEPNMATIAGLLYYSLGINKSYQLDSSKKLVKPLKKDRVVEPKISVIETPTEKPVSQPVKEAPTKSASAILTPIAREKKKGVSKFWNKVSEWF